MNDEVLEEAKKYVIKTYAKINEIDELKKSLYLFGPCLIAFPAYNYNENLWLPEKDGDELLGGHAMTVVGYNDRGFIIRNSWGNNWGEDGYCIYPYGDWNSHWELWCTVDKINNVKNVVEKIVDAVINDSIFEDEVVEEEVVEEVEEEVVEEVEEVVEEVEEVVEEEVGEDEVEEVVDELVEEEVVDDEVVEEDVVEDEVEEVVEDVVVEEIIDDMVVVDVVIEDMVIEDTVSENSDDEDCFIDKISKYCLLL